jgi:hypothetical protein
MLPHWRVLGQPELGDAYIFTKMLGHPKIGIDNL